MASDNGLCLQLFLSIFGANTMIENIMWLFSDFIQVDTIKKVSIKNDLEMSPATSGIEADNLPSCLDYSQYYQISDNEAGALNNSNTINECKQDISSPLGMSLISAKIDTPLEVTTDDNNDIPLENVTPLIPNSYAGNEKTDNEGPYSII